MHGKGSRQVAWVRNSLLCEPQGSEATATPASTDWQLDSGAVALGLAGLCETLPRLVREAPESRGGGCGRRPRVWRPSETAGP